jgi:hypothetical protein
MTEEVSTGIEPTLESSPEVEIPIESSKEPVEETPEINNEISEEDELLLANDDEVEDEDSEPEVKDDIKENIKQLKLKVNGKEYEEELPFEIAPEHLEYLQKKFQMAAAGQSAMKEKAEIDKELNLLRNQIKDNPIDLLKNEGIDVGEFLKTEMKKKIEEMKKSPEEVELEMLRKQAKEREEQDKIDKEVQEEERMSIEQKQAEEKMSNDIKDSILKNTKLKPTPKIIKRMADEMLYYIEKGRNDITPDMIAPHIEKEIHKEWNDMINDLDDETFENFIGSNTKERLRKLRLAKLKTVKNNKIVEVVKPVEPKPIEKKLKPHEWLEMLGKI